MIGAVLVYKSDRPAVASSKAKQESGLARTSEVSEVLECCLEGKLDKC
jgi:hypothetical protein